MSEPHVAEMVNLEKRVKALADSLVYIANVDDFKELIIIMKRPGWTTPAEYWLFKGLLDALDNHISAIKSIRTDLLKGAGKVGSF